jgi:hypothetical protein
MVLHCLPGAFMGPHPSRLLPVCCPCRPGTAGLEVVHNGWSLRVPISAQAVEELREDVGAVLVGTVSRRLASSQAIERSTFQRWRPSRWLESTPRCAIRGLMPCSRPPE